MVFANDFAKRDGVFRLDFLTHSDAFQKCDGFVATLNGEVWIIDGGMPAFHRVHETLLSLRRAYLDGMPELVEDDNCKLRVTWAISHFHTDHIGATLDDIFPDPRICIDTVLVPPATAYTPEAGCASPDGDTKYREVFAEALRTYAGGTPKTHFAPFGADGKYTLPMNDATVTVYPPTHDWGVGERFEKLVRYYSKGDRLHSQATLSLTNANTQWFKITYAGKTVLLTGDTMKRTESKNDEPLDEMLDAYRADIGEVNILKYVHHGLSRDHAAALMTSLDPDYYVFTGRGATAPDAICALLPERARELKERFCYLDQTDVHFEIDARGRITRRAIPVRAEANDVNAFAEKTGKLQVDFLPSPGHGGSDAFVGKTDGYVFLIDGGNDNTVSLDYLLALRRAWCDAGGLDADDPKNKLKLDLVISHFHVDHVTALFRYVIPNCYLAIENVYMPAATSLMSEEYGEMRKNGDLVFRPQVMAALARYQPHARLHTVDFRQQLTERLMDGKMRFDFYGATEDWGRGDVADTSRGIGYLSNLYFKDSDEESRRFFLPIAAVNANCMWFKITYGERVFLFLGDTFKKLEAKPCGEPMDDVVAFYGIDEFQCDVMKYPHHGHHRRAARYYVANGMHPTYVIFTIREATSGADMDALGVRWFNCAEETVGLATDGQSLDVTRG